AHIQDDILSVEEEVKQLNYGGRLIALLADIRSPQACREIVNETISTFSSLFGLVNNAGLTFTYIAPHRYRRGYSEKFFELSDDVVQNVMDTNFVAADRMARLVTPHLIKQGDGRLVNVTTRIETMTKPGASPYGPSKAALENASEVWVKDLEDTGVTVNILNPGGAANTEGFEISEDRAIASEVVGGMVEPYKMVAPICWLISDDAKNTTGMRYDASDWDESLPPEDEALRVGRPLGLTLKPLE
ncbi:MAG TPA: SDR family oxidoreductase, partial [Rhodospirillales bacterium]|nr:SDR family oxidoreductase [Rhodospirillales bacterium]